MDNQPSTNQTPKDDDLQSQPSQSGQIDVSQQLVELQKKCDEYLAGWQRAKADYSNLQKDVAREKAEIIRFAGEAIILELVPIFDNFQSAMRHVPNNQKTEDWVIGIEQIKKQLADFLKTFQVESYGKEGEQFDPNLYEALDEVEQEGTKSGSIVKVVRVGYKLYGRVIRPGQVIVAK
jgi:molecular chaperone GrpE